MRRQVRRSAVMGTVATVAVVSGARRNRAQRQAYEASTQQMNDQQQPAADSTVDPTEELMKFKKLLDAGAITQEEYDKKKAELLGL